MNGRSVLNIGGSGLIKEVEKFLKVLIKGWVYACRKRYDFNFFLN